MASSHDGDDVLFDAEPYRANDNADLMDLLAAQRVTDANTAVPTGPPDPWYAVGIDRSEIARWKDVISSRFPRKSDGGDVGVKDAVPSEKYARAAGRWHALDFTAAQAVEWIEVLDHIDDWDGALDAAADWRAHGFAPEEARPWIRGGVTPDEEPKVAQLFRDAGWHPYTVWALYQLAIRSTNWDSDRRKWVSVPQLHALDCARAGLSPMEAELLVGLEEEELQERLERRHDDRPRIDPHVALMFNHYIVPWDDVPEDIPFWCRRLWDSQDEDDDKARRRGVDPTYGGPHVKKPRWKQMIERAESEAAEATRKAIPPCPGSGGDGVLDFRDGMEEWYVQCPVCGMTWMGGNGSPLPIHNKPGDPRYRG